MAFPVGVRTKPKVSDYAVRLRVYPTTDGFASVELQRSSSGSTFVRITVFEPQAGTLSWAYTDYLPSDGGTRNYRVRAVADGYTPSTWSATASATPSSVNPTDPQVPLESNVELPSFYVGSTASIRVGAVGGSSYRAKIIRIPYSEFLPESNAFSYTADGYLSPSSDNTEREFSAPLVLSPGCVITGFSYRAWDQSTTPGRIQVEIRDYDDNNNFVQYGTTAAQTTGRNAASWHTKTFTGLTLTVSTANQFLEIRARMRSTGGATLERIQHMQVSYRMGAYEQGV